MIRALGRRVVADVVEIGRRLSACRIKVGHGNWLSWLDREFGWSERTARNFMRVTDLAMKSATVADLDIPMRGLYLLAAPSTPTSANFADLAGKSPNFGDLSIPVSGLYPAGGGLRTAGQVQEAQG